jgi:hypothetical protein
MALLSMRNDSVQKVLVLSSNAPIIVHLPHHYIRSTLPPNYSPIPGIRHRRHPCSHLQPTLRLSQHLPYSPVNIPPAIPPPLPYLQAAAATPALLSTDLLTLKGHLGSTMCTLPVLESTTKCTYEHKGSTQAGQQSSSCVCIPGCCQHNI